MVIERLLTMIPSFIIMAKIIKPGIEGIMISLSMTIINLNQFVMRNALGTFVNDHFVGITNATIDQYWILALIELIFKILPFFYIYCLVPSNDSINELQDKYIQMSKYAEETGTNSSKVKPGPAGSSQI